MVVYITHMHMLCGVAYTASALLLQIIAHILFAVT